MGFKKIIELKEIIVEQSNRVERMLENCIHGISNQDREILLEVIEKQEKKVNKKEIKIDEVITAILALYHPEAKELRYVVMMTRMNYDLERMADHCVEVAESVLFLLDKPPVQPLMDLSKIFETTLAMLRDSVTAFIHEDIPLSLDVIERDSFVDQTVEQVFRELLTCMISDPKTIERMFHLIQIARNLERVADLSTNICEETVYIAEGEIIKHHRYKKYINRYKMAEKEKKIMD